MLVIGCGSGRQFDFLAPHGFELYGLDISPTMVETCRRRFPDIRVEVAGVVGADKLFPQVDAVVSSAVLAHVAPSEIDAAIASIRRLARRSIVLREKTRFEEASDYQWQHDYDGLLDGWSCVHREVTDVGDTFTAELVAWERPGA